MHIREATKEDIPAIQDLAYAIWPHTYGKIISNEQLVYMLALMYDQQSLMQQMQKGQTFLLALDENNVPAGFASYSLKAEEVPVSYRLNKLYVLPSHQGKGLGKQLLLQVIDTVNKQGAAKLDLTVNRNNPAQYFYHQQGFEIIREEDADIGNGFFMNDYVMERNV